jgi:hypothetical protein
MLGSLGRVCGLLACGWLVSAQSAAPAFDINAELEKVDCSSLQLVAASDGKRLIKGTVPNEEAKGEVAKIIANVPEATRPTLELDILKPPLCGLLREFDQMRKFGLVFDDAIAAEIPGDGGPQREGTPLRVQIKGRANYPMELRIDYFMLDGNVLHMWPNPDLPNALIKPGETRMFDKRDAQGAAFEITAPFGTEFVAVTATPKVLDLGAVRPLVESGAGYVNELKAAISKLVIPPDQSNQVTTLIIHTAPK